MTGILLDNDDDLRVQTKRDEHGKITGGLVVGGRKIQDAYLVLKANQGEYKEDPVAGANLLRNIRGKANKEAIKKAISVSLLRIGIVFDDIKNDIQAIINKENINL